MNRKLATYGRGMLRGVLIGVFVAVLATSVQAQACPGPTPSYGTTGIVCVQGDASIPVAQNRDVFDRVSYAAEYVDQWQGLRDQDGFFLVENRTDVRVVDIDWRGGLKIEILEGEHRGRSGWIAQKLVTSRR